VLWRLPRSLHPFAARCGVAAVGWFAENSAGISVMFFQSFRLQQDKALENAAEYGFDLEELKVLPDLQFVARNLDSGGELGGRIKV